MSPATSAYTEIAGAMMQNNGIDPNTGNPVGSSNSLDANWKQVGTEFADYAYLPYSEPNAGFRWLDGAGGNDTIQGGNGDNVIYGGAGDDSLGGGYCVNFILGEEGNDSIYGGNLQDLVSGGVGNDRLFGYDGTDYLIGNDGDDSLDGMNGDDYMQGGAGRDTLKGGTGNDFYYIDDMLDSIVELANQGTDVVVASINFSLANLPNIEHIGLTGEATQATGHAGNNIVQGNLTRSSSLFGLAGNDTLYSESGHDTLDGGTGNDSMEGGTGNDTYIVDSAGDVVVEAANAGTDTVRSSVTRTLGANQENLVLTGAAAIQGSGNGLNNTLTGNAAANILNGLAGNDVIDGLGGNDTMNGGTGNDTYTVDSPGDVINELANAGIDTVRSSVTRTLGINQENLLLLGAADLQGSGNSLNNLLTGNAGANVLNGFAGNDTMNGGAGNDTYFVDSAGDVINELANAGTDTVRSSVTRTLGANQENLALLGTSPIHGVGNTLGNVLSGNGTHNRLEGSLGRDTLTGGDGNDTLIGAATTGALGAAEVDVLSGGLGADVFVLGVVGGRLYDDTVVSTPGVGGYALITDFGNGADQLQLKGSASPQRYFLGNSPFVTPGGRGLYHDSNANGVLNPATDELIAVIQGPNAAQALASALYV